MLRLCRAAFIDSKGFLVFTGISARHDRDMVDPDEH
jgi:hypothetical protein